MNISTVHRILFFCTICKFSFGNTESCNKSHYYEIYYYIMNSFYYNFQQLLSWENYLTVAGSSNGSANSALRRNTFPRLILQSILSKPGTLSLDTTPATNLYRKSQIQKYAYKYEIILIRFCIGKFKIYPSRPRITCWLSSLIRAFVIESLPDEVGVVESCCCKQKLYKLRISLLNVF